MTRGSGDGEAAPTDPFGWVGATLGGQFTVQAVVGEGGFGVVYRGWHCGLGVPVAIKCLKLSTGRSALELGSLLKRLKNEARLLHEVSRQTAGVVQSLYVGAAVAPTGVWTPYLVMEWVDGETLAQSLAKWRQAGAAPPGIAAAARLLEPAAAALAAAHELDVAHLDLKPSNLALAHVGAATRLKVLDFGQARPLVDSGDAASAQARGGRIFTPGYGAPEQFSAQYGTVGTWTDVFAMALLVVEVASGRPALEGDSVMQLFAAAIDEGSRSVLLARVPGLTGSTEAVLRRALDVNPQLRFRTVGALWGALEAALASKPQNPCAEPGPEADTQETQPGVGPPLRVAAQPTEEVSVTERAERAERARHRLRAGDRTVTTSPDPAGSASAGIGLRPSRRRSAAGTRRRRAGRMR